MGLELTKLEEKIKDRYINAWKAVTANIIAERNAESSRIAADAQRIAADKKKTKVGYGTPSAKDISIFNFLF